MELNVPSGDHEAESNLTTARTVSDAEEEGEDREILFQRSSTFHQLQKGSLE